MYVSTASFLGHPSALSFTWVEQRARDAAVSGVMVAGSCRCRDTVVFGVVVAGSCRHRDTAVSGVAGCGGAVGAGTQWFLARWLQGAGVLAVRLSSLPLSVELGLLLGKPAGVEVQPDQPAP